MDIRESGEIEDQNKRIQEERGRVEGWRENVHVRVRARPRRCACVVLVAISGDLSGGGTGGEGVEDKSSEIATYIKILLT